MIIPFRPRLASTLTPRQSAECLRHEAARLEETARIKRLLAEEIDPTCPEPRANETPGSPTQTEGDPHESA